MSDYTKSTKIMSWVGLGFLGIVIILGIMATVVSDDSDNDEMTTEPPTTQQQMF